MDRAALESYLEKRINDKARIILNEDMVHDGAALGEMQLYFCMRRILNKKANLEDIGTLRAMNNLMQILGLLSPKETLISKIEK